MSPFRVALSSDFRKSDGSPAFPTFDLTPFDGNPEIEYSYVTAIDGRIPGPALTGFDALILLAPRFDAGSIPADNRLALVARFGVGYDSVDVAACTAKGITVTNTPLAIRRPVAVAALTLIFALSGRLMAKDRLVRTGRWNERTDHMGAGLTGRVLGLIGAGGIGQELIPLARPFFREIIVADPHVEASVIEGLGARKLPFAEVLAQADFLTAACPLNDETHHLMGAEAFASMKPTACFINVSRGPVHDEAALVAALRTGQIAGAALDVMEQEPIAADSPLIGMANTILTPHALCWTDECFEDIARAALRSIVDVSLGLAPTHPVAG